MLIDGVSYLQCDLSGMSEGNLTHIREYLYMCMYIYSIKEYLGVTVDSLC